MSHDQLLAWIKKHSLLVVITFIILILALGVRVAYLGQIPAAFSHDELNYLINAVSVAWTGFGKSGEWSPWSLSPVEPTLAELPALLLAPAYYLPVSWMVAPRLLFVFMSLTIPLFMAAIAWQLTNSKASAYFTWVLGLFNPWLWQMSRLTFDPLFSLWFYLLGMATFLIAKRYWKLLALLPFFLGFYGYQGFKPILPLLAVTLAVYQVVTVSRFSWSKLVQTKWWKKQLPSLLVVMGTILLFSLYIFFQFAGQSESQYKLSNQIVTPQSEVVSQAVQTDRRLALSTPFNLVFINKYVQWSKEITGRYLRVFGARELFYEISASNSSFSVWNHGMMYLVTGLLIMIGAYQFVRQGKYASLLLLSSLLLIGGLPSAINQGTWLFFRSSFMIPMFLIIAGYAVAKLWRESRWAFIGLAILYVVSVLNFGFLYFVRYPVFGAEGIVFSPRLLAAYLSRAPQEQKVVIYDHEVEYSFTSYLYYNQLFTKEQAQDVQQQFRQGSHTGIYRWKNITFAGCLPADFTVEDGTTYIFDRQVLICPSTADVTKEQLLMPLEEVQPTVYLQSIKDSGTDYTIYGDQLCFYEELGTYTHVQHLEELSLTGLSKNDFCKTWVKKDL